MRAKGVLLAIGPIVAAICVGAMVGQHSRPGYAGKYSEVIYYGPPPLNSTVNTKPVSESAPPGLTSNSGTSPDPALLAEELRDKNDATRAIALRQLSTLAISDRRSLASGLPRWINALVDNGRYEEARDYSLASIVQRPFDSEVVIAAQRAIVLALISQNDPGRSVQEAKRYYYVASLAGTGDAVDLFAQALASSGDTSAAATFRAGQAFQDAFTERFKSVNLASEDYKNVLTTLQDSAGSKGYSYSNLMGQGNLFLMLGDARSARSCFESACKIAGDKPKNLRLAVEGVARAIRDDTGSPTLANDFVVSLLNSSPSLADPLQTNGFPSLDDLREAAQNTQLADVRVILSPPLEEQRLHQNLDPRIAAIEVSSNFECGTPVNVQRLSSSELHIAVNATAPPGCWFMFRVEGAAGRIVRIDLTGNHNVDISKWQSLNPVYSDGDQLDQLDAPPDGVSDNSPTITAWNGTTLPLTSGQVWHFIPDVWMQNSTTLSFVHRFLSNHTYIAMRVPYTPSFNEAALGRLAKNPRVKLIHPGRSKGGRPLLLVQIGNTDLSGERAKPCILVYAGEHADEPDAMWTALGIARFLSSDDPEAQRLREDVNFLVVPMLDPDAAAAAIHENIIGKFLVNNRTQESITYANWFEGWANAGRRLDVVFDLHNIQSEEGPNLFCALLEGLGARGRESFALHRLIMDGLGAEFTFRSSPAMRGWSPNRMGGWLSHYFGPITLAYEINSQGFPRHLNVREMSSIGIGLLKSADRFLASREGVELLKSVDELRRERLSQPLGQSVSTRIPDAIAFEAARAAALSGASTEHWVP
jgi:hypothetical protein